jgi:hypothetical protein
MRDYRFEQWSRLDERQLRCIARFVRFMIAVSALTGDDYQLKDWQEVYENNWKSVDQG